MQYPGPGNNLLKALEVAGNDLFSVKNGARFDADRKLIVFIDKLLYPDQELAKTVKKMKENGIDMIFVGVGPSVDKDSLLSTLSDGAKAHFVTDYQEPDEGSVLALADLARAGWFPGCFLLMFMINNS